jgi:DNA polymerase-3 subunit delta'
MDINRGFETISGHKQVIDSLKRIIQNGRVMHAYIFSGPDGIGKRTVAQIFAGLLLCENPKESVRCGFCSACSLLGKNSCPDLVVIPGEGRSIGIDEIRELQSGIIIRPLYSARKVCIICNSEKMTVEAQNCLLKTLESPPEYSVIILTTSNFDSLLPTIKSRVVRFNFSRNTQEEVEQIIEDKLGKNHSMKELLAAYAEGSAGTAVRFAETGAMLDVREGIIDIILGLKRAGLDFIIKKYEFFEQYKENIDDIFHIMRLLYRDFLSVVTGSPQSGLNNADKKDIIINNADKYTATELVNILEAINEAERELKFNAGFENVIKVMLIRISEENC